MTERVRPRPAMEIPCPICDAQAAEACRNPITGEAYRHYAPHLARVKEARGW